MSADETLIRIVRGSPEHDEVAAAVIALMSTGTRIAEPQPEQPRPGWRLEAGYRPPGAWTSG